MKKKNKIKEHNDERAAILKRGRLLKKEKQDKIDKQKAIRSAKDKAKYLKSKRAKNSL